MNQPPPPVAFEVVLITIFTVILIAVACGATLGYVIGLHKGLAQSNACQEKP
jgi:ABC-type dipeptide/oligopeptide/nickel transport system permease subunit